MSKCSNCGRDILERHKTSIYCLDCSIPIKIIGNRIRGAIYRIHHRDEYNERSKEWRKDNPIRTRVIQRRYTRKNLQSRLEYQRKYRAEHPEWYKQKMKECNERRKFYKEQSRELRNFFVRHNVVVGVTCVTCGEIIPTRHRGREYCGPCYEKKVRTQRLAKTPEEKKEEWDRNREICVGVDCLVCGEFVIGTRAKRFCEKCSVLWAHNVPSKVIQELKNSSSFKKLPEELSLWKSVIDLRNDVGYVMK